MPDCAQSLFIVPAPSVARPWNVFKLLLILLYVAAKLSVRALAHEDKKKCRSPRPEGRGY
jgi:hypothetical protein